jgi:hypothetical protein
MNAVHFRHNLRANGAEKINAAWHITNNVARTSWSKEVIYRGVDLALDENTAADSRLMSLLKEDDLYKRKGTGQAQKIKLTSVYERFWHEHDFIAKRKPLMALRSRVGGRMNVCMAGLQTAARYMRDNPELLVQENAHRRSVDWNTTLQPRLRDVERI